MGKVITVSNDDIYTTISVGPLTRVDVLDYTNNIYARGFAKHNAEDIYDESFGIQLAFSRAYSRYHRKLEKALVRATNPR